MFCTLCSNSFSPEQQSPACPHLNLDPPKPRLGGPKLRPDIQWELDDAFALRDREKLTEVFHTSLNFAARYYARHLLKRLDSLDKESKLLSTMGKEND